MKITVKLSWELVWLNGAVEKSCLKVFNKSRFVRKDLKCWSREIVQKFIYKETV